MTVFRSENAGASGDVADEGNVTNVLIGDRILDVEANGEGPWLLCVHLDEACVLQHFDVIGHCGR